MNRTKDNLFFIMNVLLIAGLIFGAQLIRGDDQGATSALPAAQGSPAAAPASSAGASAPSQASNPAPGPAASAQQPTTTIHHSVRSGGENEGSGGYFDE